jgi:YHS domain-containing protein
MYARILSALAAPALVVALALVAFGNGAQAELAEPEAAVAHYDLKDDLALQGYDPVAYFTQSAAVKGESSLSLKHRGVIYRFANEAHRLAFEQDPDRYRPAYGGWCAWAMASGSKTSPDPENFIVAGDRLFLFYRGYFVDTKSKWLAGDPEQLERKADSHWATTLQS